MWIEIKSRFETQKTCAVTSLAEVWIEMEFPHCIYHISSSLSARRVWIEILSITFRSWYWLVTLCEESVDWNFFYFHCNLFSLSSLSARRVWIEIPEVRGFKHKFSDNSHIDICANLHNQGTNVYILLQSIPFNIKQYFQQYFTLKISYTEKCKFTYCFITNSLTQIENLTIIMAQ